MPGSDFEDWMRLARDDLESAKYLLGMEPRRLEIICYHCHQCAEKALKAVLVKFGEEIPRSHDLRFLLHRCSIHAQPLVALTEVLPRLQPYAVAVRYPYEAGVIAGDEGRAIADAAAVLAAVEAELHG